MAKSTKKTRPAKKKAVKAKPSAKKKPVKKTAPAKKKVVVKKKQARKKAPAKKQVARKKAPAKKQVARKKAPAKKQVARKKAPAEKQVRKKPAAKKKSGPMFDKISPSTPPQPASGDNPYNIKIVNMVASANFNVDLDLFALAREVDTIEYEPEQFPGAILKLQEPKSSLLLFKNGKVICTGARSETDVEKALLRTTEIISKYVS